MPKGGETTLFDREPVPPKPSDLIFPSPLSRHLHAVLTEEDLKFDRERRPRTAYSLRLTRASTPPTSSWNCVKST
jgi:hypothetical protein